MSSDEYRPVTNYSLEIYPCGLSTGDQLRLKKEIRIKDDEGKETGISHSKGEIWTVLNGVLDEPEIIWLRQINGCPHTWDASDIFDTFTKIEK
jgi:hypothetical protein